MHNDTAKRFSEYMEQTAKANGKITAGSTFQVEGAAEFDAIAAVRAADPLLAKINFFPVRDPQGHAVGGVSAVGSIAARTDTRVRARAPRAAGIVDERTAFECERTEYDTALPFSLLDAWAHLPDFGATLDAALAKKRGLDRLMIGFNGTHAAPESDRDTFPRLQDVNIGWLEKIRSKAPGQVKAEGTAGSGVVTIGAGGNFAGLDALVFAAVQMLSEEHRQRRDLVVLLNRDLIQTQLVADAADPAVNRILATGKIASLAYHEAPFFPSGALLVTTLENLSIYYQAGSMRRFIKQEPEASQVCDYQTLAEAFVIEDFGLAALVENIQPV